MKTGLKKSIAAALSLAICTTALVGLSTFGANADETAPAGYLTSPTQNVYLNPGEYYKQFYGAEDGETAPTSAIAVSVDTTVFNSGAKSVKATIQSHSEAAGRLCQFKVSAANADMSGAKYFQFWVESTVAGFPSQIRYINFNDGKTLFQTTEQNIMLFDQGTGKWSKASIAVGPLGKAIQLPDGFKGFVRYDLSEASAEIKGLLNSVNAVEIYGTVNATNADGTAVNGKAMYFDDFGFVTYNGETAPAYKDKIDWTAYTDKPAQKVYLNPGEIYQQLFGGEQGDTAALTKNSSATLVGDTKNSGDSAICAECSDGSAGGFKVLQFTPAASQTNWTNAKYMQFWIDNTAPTSANPVELFYVTLNQKLMFTKGFTGIKLYDQVTGKWSDLAVSDNSFHVMGTDKTPVPTLKIPAGFRGFVRIPLTADAIQSVLSNVTEVQSYILCPGTPGPTKYYFDDFGLVSYKSDAAPAYADGTPEPTTTAVPTDATTPDTTGTTPNFGEDTTAAPADNTATTEASNVKTGVENHALPALLVLVVSGAVALSLTKFKVKQ